jgi:hypothetical protein
MSRTLSKLRLLIIALSNSSIINLLTRGVPGELSGIEAESVTTITVLRGFLSDGATILAWVYR